MEQQKKNQIPPQTPKGQVASQPPRGKKLGKLKEQIHKLPDKKPHLDFIAAILTIPVLLTVLVLNLISLQSRNSNTKLTPTPAASPSPITQNTNSANQKTITPLQITSQPQPTTNQQVCIKDIGPIDIAYPQEGQNVPDNPLCIQINYHAGNYCSVVWAYSINHSQLSDYSNNSVCLYNLPEGPNTFLLQVKSLASSSTQTLQRNFIYHNPSITPTNAPTATTTVTPANPTP